LHCKLFLSCRCAPRVCLIPLIPCHILLLSNLWSLWILVPKLLRTGLVWSTLDLSGDFQTGLVWPVPDLSGTQQSYFQNQLTSSILIPSCPFLVVNLYSISLISGWTLITRKEPRTDKISSGPPSGVAQARCMWLMGLLLLIHITTLLILAKKKRSVSFSRSTLQLSAPTAFLRSIPRR
jgi:hypothetical protein